MIQDLESERKGLMLRDVEATIAITAQLQRECVLFGGASIRAHCLILRELRSRDVAQPAAPRRRLERQIST